MSFVLFFFWRMRGNRLLYWCGLLQKREDLVGGSCPFHTNPTGSRHRPSFPACVFDSGLNPANYGNLDTR